MSAIPQALMSPSPWHAALELTFARMGPRSILRERRHHGPLVIQKALYPEGDAVCHGIILHPPGGVAGGDQLALHAVLEADAQVLLTTPGAGKWYKAHGATASQTLHFEVDQGGLLEWLPQENILYDAADADWQMVVELQGENARYAGWEITCLGRQASGERFNQGRIRQRVEIRRDGARLWHEQGLLLGGSRMLQSLVGLAAHPVYATFVIAAGEIPPTLVEGCREIPVPAGTRAGVTALPGVLIIRLIAAHAEIAKGYLEAVWAVTRPWYAGLAAQRPRIWNT